MLWIKAFHIIFVITWFAAIFYLPRLFVYHAGTTDREGSERFKVMERKLYRGIMTPSATLAVLSGLWLYLGFGFTGGWFHAKIFLVVLLLAYHFWCGKLLRDFAAERNARSHVWFRWFNEVPVAFLIGIVILVVVKPF
jgi:putative membrane protein